MTLRRKVSRKTLGTAIIKTRQQKRNNKVNTRKDLDMAIEFIYIFAYGAAHLVTHMPQAYLVIHMPRAYLVNHMPQAYLVTHMPQAYFVTHMP